MSVESIGYEEDESLFWTPVAREGELHGRAVKRCEDGGISYLIKPMEVSGSAEIKASIEWGGREGTQFSVGASGKVQDDHGSYGEVSIKQDSSGKGSVEVSAGCETTKKEQ